jgi:galactokinase
MESAEICQHAEWVASGVRSGILDQAASYLGRPGQAVLLDCRSLEYRYLPFVAPGVSLVVIDTGVRRELAASAYNERRAQCEQATSLLHAQIARHEPTALARPEILTLRDISPEEFARYQESLPDVLRRRAGYIIAENQRVLETVARLERHDLEVPGVLGARMMGGGFGGCTVNLVRDEALAQLTGVVEEQYPPRTGLQAGIDICHAAGGPGSTPLNI